MTIKEFKQLIQNIVAKSFSLSIAHTAMSNTPVNYACIFTHEIGEYDNFIILAKELGSILKETETGPVFHITELSTVAGNLPLLKIRRPDKERPEQGDADFTIADYEKFKNGFLGKTGFSLIKRPEMEMIELIDSSYDVLAYYSSPTLTTVLGL